jgi:hypothetical protein
LDAASDYLGEGYKEMDKDRFVFADGERQVRIKDGDILGDYGGGPHINFEALKPKYKNSYVYLID